MVNRAMFLPGKVGAGVTDVMARFGVGIVSLLLLVPRRGSLSGRANSASAHARKAISQRLVPVKHQGDGVQLVAWHVNLQHCLSLSSSTPTKVPGTVVSSAKVTKIGSVPATMWLFVTMCPSVSYTKPDPNASWFCAVLWITRIVITDGLTCI